MLFLQTDPPHFTPPQKTDVDRLQDRLDQFVTTLDGVFPQDQIARALLTKGADVMMQSDGVFAARWTARRLEDLLCGGWVPSNLKSFIESYRK
jgi:hypothetical protein